MNRMDDLISRQAAIDALCKAGCGSKYCGISCDDVKAIEDLPSVQLSFSQQHEKDAYYDGYDNGYNAGFEAGQHDVLMKDLPSAQPERTCVNCGRTANNGGWYADGRTRCPIEEHYALPKDGYCHLWEKRNVTDDDYPERREE